MPNRLIHEKSPYLLQHAHNPVDWYPWGEEAFSRAREDRKPIFLSVGYSTCHWCHVMERESFEDPGIAAILNEHFVPVKVDREERPDVDRIYMTSLQAMGQNGGWPMSMFLTPELRPFYGGTYYPPETRYGRAGFPDVLRRVHQAWTSEKEKVLESADSLMQFLSDVEAGPGERGAISPESLTTCQRQLSGTYDSEFGGFGGGPKFPRPVVFGMLLRHFARTGSAASLQMTERTLQKMALGGMYDHVGGGFHRYSVDREWRVPHFEKMLYDQAQLVTSYVETYQATGNPFYAAVVNETVEYVLRDLTASDGGFLSAEDADSPRPESPDESGEGSFYVWTKAEIARLLGRDAPLVSMYYGVEEGGNAPYDPQMEFTGRNILYVARSVTDAARAVQSDETAVKLTLALARTALFNARAGRPRPHRDDKVIASWNGLMIGALARAGTVLRKPEWIAAAERACGFVLTRLRQPGTGKLLRRFRDGDARFPGQLDDYANIIAALLELFESTSNVAWLEEAVALAGIAAATFEDPASGGFFDTPGSDSGVLVRLKEQYDGAEPTGNSVMALNMIRLGHLTGNQEWLSRAERILQAFSGMLSKQPVVMPNMVSAADAFLNPPVHVVIAGRRGESLTEELVSIARRGYNPGRMVIVTGEGGERERLVRLAPYLSSVGRTAGLATAFLCRDLACSLPTNDPRELERMLSGSSVTAQADRQPPAADEDHDQ